MSKINTYEDRLLEYLPEDFAILAILNLSEEQRRSENDEVEAVIRQYNGDLRYDDLIALALMDEVADLTPWMDTHEGYDFWDGVEGYIIDLKHKYDKDKANQRHRTSMCNKRPKITKEMKIRIDQFHKDNPQTGDRVLMDNLRGVRRTISW